MLAMIKLKMIKLLCVILILTVSLFLGQLVIFLFLECIGYFLNGEWTISRKNIVDWFFLALIGGWVSGLVFFVADQFHRNDDKKY